MRISKAVRGDFVLLPVPRMAFMSSGGFDVGHTILLGGKMISTDAGTKDRKIRSAIVPLKAGLHKMSLRYNHRGGDSSFRFRWGIKGRGLTQAWGGEFVH